MTGGNSAVDTNPCFGVTAPIAIVDSVETACQPTSHCDGGGYCQNARAKNDGVNADGSCERLITVTMLNGGQVDLLMDDPVRAGMVKSCLEDKLRIHRGEMQLLFGSHILRDHERVPPRVVDGTSEGLFGTSREDAVILSLVRVPRLPGWLALQGFASVNDRGGYGATTLQTAANRDDSLLCLEILAQEDFNTINVADFLGSTPLHVVIERGLSDVTAAILRREDLTSINVRNRNGRTALHLAAARGDDATCERILAHALFERADVVDALGQTPADLAEALGRESLARMLRLHVSEEGVVT
eukprot:TRINITY_DN25120_c0_g1_i1.p1 TRINITY_DN25120_c0_g1~~TRINITY_DN25120_c0_g1_i1.p1  ORF type:complete len:328 (-),score=46.46 TRINITY_DN25120_c0_g1_i1:17-919(-)